MNIAGAKTGERMFDPVNPAKFTFCFGENEEENPWTPYHVQRGFAPTDNVVTVMSGEGPHNLNDHGSTTGDGLLTTFAGSMSTPGANTVYGKGPMLVIIGPEHAATLNAMASPSRAFARASNAACHARGSQGEPEDYPARPKPARLFPIPLSADIHIPWAVRASLGLPSVVGARPLPTSDCRMPGAG